MANIFALPIASSRIQFTSWGVPATSHKRKKPSSTRDADPSSEEVEREARGGNIEYSAVITPEERTQRRVAGQPLNQAPPGLPFPHAKDTAIRTNPRRRPIPPVETGTKQPEGQVQSLHTQHVAVLMTVLHQSLLRDDMPRAARALGLLFREEMIAGNAAMRTHGLVGIAAEVLLRNGSPRESQSRSPRAPLPFTRDGFERAKRLYERLIVRHPYHKSWPNAVNAIDFYLAMFNLWVYVVHAEHTVPPAGEDYVDADTDAEQKMRELAQATQIADRLDTCMASVPYMDEAELIRLRANIALWTADLHEDCAIALARQESQMNDTVPALDDPSEWQAGRPTSIERDHSREAVRARELARELFSKVDGDKDDESTGSDG
jgi:hypothetical protein